MAKEKLQIIKVNEEPVEYGLIWCPQTQHNVLIKSRVMERYKDTYQVRRFKIFCVLSCNPGCEYFEEKKR